MIKSHSCRLTYRAPQWSESPPVSGLPVAERRRSPVHCGSPSLSGLGCACGASESTAPGREMSSCVCSGRREALSQSMKTFQSSAECILSLVCPQPPFVSTRPVIYNLSLIPLCVVGPAYVHLIACTEHTCICDNQIICSCAH